jgi:restriction system protein
MSTPLEDYLFHRLLPQWAPASAEALAVRGVGQRQSRGDQSNPPDPCDPQAGRRALHALYAPWLDQAKPGVRANAIICLIHQANYLLDQQITALERAFVMEGGYSEQLATARLARRTHRDSSDPPDPSDLIPQCPRCGKPMALRTAKTGKHAGNQFWGCTGYPDCKGTAVI